MTGTDSWGIDTTYEDAFGEDHAVSEKTIDRLRRSIGSPAEGQWPLVVRSGTRPKVGQGQIELEDGTELEVDGRLSPDLPLGYHHLVVEGERRSLIVSPGRCHLPTGRRWGWATQLYAARSRHSWGMGDFADLEFLTNWARRTGAEMLIVNPFPAVSPTLPQQPSPYFPASRRFHNPLYLRVENVPGAHQLGDRLTEAASAGRALNDSRAIDRDEVWRLKSHCLKHIWEAAPPGSDFDGWRRSQGEALTVFSAWCVLAEDHGADWRRWPNRYRHPSTSAVSRLTEEQPERILFHQWLQWLCRSQVDRASGPVTLIQDLPIGVDPGGADAWAWQDLLALDMSIGAPPDEFNAKGQNWGLPPFIPHRLRASDYEPFIQTIRANLTRGGGLRIDHVMGLFRLFWIPEGAGPSEGAFVRYPADDLLDIVALESHRAEALVVGEDLGTVEAGVRGDMAARRMLSYRLLWFEEQEPRHWPSLSLASVTTHDLPTVTGLWTGKDLNEQALLDMEPNVESTEQVRTRVADWAGLDESAPPEEAVVAIHRLLAQAPSRLLSVTLDDAACMERRPNIPGSDPRRHNWAVPLSRPIDQIVEDPLPTQLAAILTSGVSAKERNDA